MCVILDANLAADVFRTRTPSAFAPLVAWLFKGNGKLVYGGQNATELLRIHAAVSAIRQLRLAGRACWEDSARIDVRTRQVADRCSSDDPHMIALALASGARTLCSHDQDLHADFCNRALVSRPRGAVYQDESHAHLPRHTSGCPGSGRRRR